MTTLAHSQTPGFVGLASKNQHNAFETTAADPTSAAAALAKLPSIGRAAEVPAFCHACPKCGRRLPSSNEHYWTSKLIPTGGWITEFAGHFR